MGRTDTEQPVDAIRRSLLSRSTQIAIAAAGYLAEIHKNPDQRLSAKQISESRNLRSPYLGKVLSELSKAGIIEGTRGPGGGFRLTRQPRHITLKEIAELFEREDTVYMCPYGKDYCGTGPRCPLHDQLEALNNRMDRFLERTSLGGFERRQKPN